MIEQITKAICSLIFLTTCNSSFAQKDRTVRDDEKDKIFHAAPSMSDGIGGTFFALYKNNKYQFCDGNFVDPGCYTGKYKLAGDTLTLIGLKLNDHVKSNRFIIYRYSELDSTYWKRKYVNSGPSWRDQKTTDSLNGSGDIYELDKNNRPRTDVKYWYVIRLDKLKNNR